MLTALAPATSSCVIRPNNLVDASIAYQPASNSAVLDPSSNLSFATTYTALVKGGADGVTDAAGVPLASDYTWSFTTESSDTTPPTVISVSPANGASEVLISTDVSAIFSEAMDASTINDTNFELRDPYNVAVPAVVSYNAGTNAATLNPTTELNYGAVYTARILSGSTGVKDLAGYELGTDYVWSFTTSTQPSVSSVSPASGAIEVLIPADVSAVFSKAMDSSTINATNFELRDPTDALVPASVSYNAVTLSAVLNPTSDLAYSTTYTAIVKGGSSGVKDLIGNPIPADYTWTFTTESMITTPPTVTSVKPIDEASRLRLATNATAYFSRAMDPATINASTFELRDAGNNLIPATVTYNSADNSANLNPNTDLSYSTTYTARIVSGAGGVKDSNSIAMDADYTWSFSTIAQRPPVDQAPGGPILIITTPANLFTRYYTEILRTEGLNEYAIQEISAVTAGELAGYDIAVLGDMALTSDQVTMLTTWVEGGGHLIAMRPDKQLAGLLGLTDATSTLSNGYLLIDTSQSPGTGIVGQTLQFHGTADAYTLNGATSLATLYSDRMTATSYPAVTLHSVGTNGGLAAAFTFDLARSIVYTHQGNPAWQVGHVNPLQSYGTALDLFYDATTPWVDFQRINIPQADEQQRFLANLILTMNANKKPLPRFWYFPSGKKAAIILTGDDHWGRATPSGSTQVFFDRHISQSPTNCSAQDWECVRSSSYGYPGALLTDAQAAAYAAQGFEFGVHADAGLASGGGWCGTWPADMMAQFTSQSNAVYDKYASLPVQASERDHCYSWFGYLGPDGWIPYTATPQSNEAQGIRLDTNIAYNPTSWASVNPGYQMGSGMMMRFAQVDLSGTMTSLLDIYNAGTQMTDDNGQGAATMRTIVDSFLDAAIGPQGYYGGFVVNMHSDNWYGWSYLGSDQIVASAQAHGIPVVSGRQMVDWLDGRNSSSFGAITWDGTTLGFTVTTASGARNLQAMVPAWVGVIPLSGITHDGTTIPFTLQTIKGVEYAFFSATDGDYEATYTPDTTPATISSVVANPTTGGDATITWTTDEPASSSVDYGTAPDALTQAASDAALVTSHTISLTGLTPNTQYYYRVSSTDGSGNTATYPITTEDPLTFTTPSASFIETTVEDFSAGTPDANIYISQIGNGEVMLKPTVAAEFSGTSLPAGWNQIGTGGSYTVNNGSLTVDGANVGTSAIYAAGHSIEAVATIGGAVYQHIGFGVNLTGGAGDAWAIISTGSSGAGLLARTWNGSGSYTTETSTAIPGSYFGAPHRYRVDWGPTAIEYYVDGALVATHNLAIPIQMRPIASNSVTGGPTVSVDWLHMSPYPSSGTFTSRVFDTLGTVSSGNISWNSDTPASTSIAISIRTGNTAIPDGYWSDYAAVINGAPIGSGFRYIQYKSDLGTTDIKLTPILHDVNILFNKADDTTPPTVSARSPLAGATDVLLSSDITVEFSEPMDSTTFDTTSFRLRADGASPDVPATVSYSGLTATLHPTTPLAFGTLYHVTLAGSVTDASGNSLGSDETWSFTTVTSADFIDDTAADFTAGALDANSILAQTGNGELILKPAAGAEFTGSSLPEGWQATAFSTGGSATISNGLLTLDGARVGTTALYSPGKSLEGVATFNAVRFQHFGFAVTYMVDGTPWAIISTGANGDGLYARTYTGSGAWDTQSTPIPGNYLGTPHRYRVDWLADRFDYYVDGVLVASHNIAIATQMRPMPADLDVGGPTMTVDWMRMTPYAPSGSFTSRVFDASTGLNWQELTWIGSAPEGTAAVFETRSGNTATPDETWSSWQGLSGTTIASPTTQYLQYRVNLSTTDGNLTPVVEYVSINGNLNRAPVAQDQAVVTGEDVPADVTLNATDEDGDELTYTVIDQPAHGEISGAAPHVVYTPAANWNGSDSFTYQANDGTANSNLATVSITVNPVNDAPVAVDDTAQTIEGVAVTIPVLANDSDVDTDTLSVSEVGTAAHGTAVISGGGTTVTYTPAAGYSGPDSFTYTVSDGHGGTASASVSVTVLADLIFGNGFEGGLSDWSAAVTGGGDLSVTPGAAMVGSSGLQAVINDTSPIYVRDDTPNNESRYRARFHFDPNGITMANYDTHSIFYGYSASTHILVRRLPHRQWRLPGARSDPLRYRYLEDLQLLPHQRRPPLPRARLAGRFCRWRQ